MIFATAVRRVSVGGKYFNVIHALRIVSRGTMMALQRRRENPLVSGNTQSPEDLEGERCLEALLNAAKGLAVVATDIRGFILFATEGAQRLFGRSSDALVGCDLLALFDDENLRRYLMWQMTNRRTLCSRRSNLISVDHPTRQIEVMLQCVLSPQNRPFGFICVISDLSKNLVKRGPHFMYWP
jgi:PAS domain-containing protein